MNRSKANIDNIIQKLGEQEEEAALNSPLKNIRGSFSLNPKVKKFEEEKRQKIEFTSESMKYGLDNVSEKYKE